MNPECGPPPRGNRPWVDASDYPDRARRQGMRGDVTFALDISAQGCPTKCTIVISSGYRLLDETTCQIMSERARFKPKLDESGRAMTAKWTNKLHWEP
ncbi:energy transducer TonB [Sphingobium sp. AN558]|uniref:energy transducer TonB n=1 Tax=Sphingobium sp. AN558 TaxID=3133442 RepID=UPI00404088BC